MAETVPRLWRKTCLAKVLPAAEEQAMQWCTDLMETGSRLCGSGSAVNGLRSRLQGNRVGLENKDNGRTKPMSPKHIG